ncbi:MAG TPA: hypothetical protein VG324_26085, partial [Blastocatellia bacterium]|nr:hypothetical protein [Blastocatellia bacterium]
MMINHEETKSTKIFLFFLRLLRFFVVDLRRSKDMSIVITTPTGNIGKHALQQLLQAGVEVSVIVRRPEKLSDSIRRRVK